MNNINITLQIILSFFAIMGICFYLWHLRNPNIKLSIISFYSSFSKEKELQSLFKLKTDSTSDLVIENLKVSINTNYSEVEMKPTNIRWKGFLPIMKDASGKDSYYALTGPISPNLYIDGIKSGVNQYYILLISQKEVQLDSKINSLTVTIKSRSPSIIAPRWLTEKTQIIKIKFPEEKDLCFDDSFIEKISKEEREKIIKGL